MDENIDWAWVRDVQAHHFREAARQLRVLVRGNQDDALSVARTRTAILVLDDLVKNIPLRGFWLASYAAVRYQLDIIQTCVPEHSDSIFEGMTSLELANYIVSIVAETPN